VPIPGRAVHRRRDVCPHPSAPISAAVLFSCFLHGMVQHRTRECGGCQRCFYIHCININVTPGFGNASANTYTTEPSLPFAFANSKSGPRRRGWEPVLIELVLLDIFLLNPLGLYNKKSVHASLGRLSYSLHDRLRWVGIELAITMFAFIEKLPPCVVGNWSYRSFQIARPIPPRPAKFPCKP
jgi:hypothetical protein